MFLNLSEPWNLTCHYNPYSAKTNTSPPPLKKRNRPQMPVFCHQIWIIWIQPKQFSGLLKKLPEVLSGGCFEGRWTNSLGQNQLVTQVIHPWVMAKLNQHIYIYVIVPSGKLTWQWKMNILKMYSLLKMGIFHCYVWLPECNWINVAMKTNETSLK